MKDSEILPVSEICSELGNNIRIACEKCGGSGNVKTPENSRRTCLSCFGRGFKIIKFSEGNKR